MSPTLIGWPDNWRLLLQCLLLSMVILIIDISIPLGIAGGVPYLIVVLLALREKDPRFPIGFAVTGSLLTLIGLMLSNPLATPWMVYSNRGLALLAIWATALLGLQLKRYQAQLSESEGRFQLLADNAPVMIWRADRQGAWDFISKGWRDFTGRRYEAELGSGWRDGIHELDVEKVVARYDACIERHERFEVQCRLRNADGAYHWILLEGVPRYLDDQSYSGYIGTALDINQRIETELKLEETRQKYYHREKMAMIGTLAEGLLHEIGNPTASIASLIQEALSEYPAASNTDHVADPVHANLLKIRDQVDRITLANQDIVNFTRLQDSKIDIHDFNQLVDRTCRLIAHDDRMRTIRLVTHLDPSLPAVEVVPDNIIQILFNLIDNSIAACHGLDNGEITVSTKAIDQGIKLSVSDNGIGMSPETLDQAKEAFYTTHPEKEGSGLGLALCISIAEEYRGSIEVESKPGQGTEVNVVLDCTADF